MFSFIKSLASAVALAAMASLPLAAQETPSLPEVESGKVLILGTYHFANPGADQFNPESDDVTTPERQAELDRLVEALAEFDPTHVAIEGRPEVDAYQQEYEAYLAGEHELNNNERQQIGFRLAKYMGHERIYPVDVSLGMQADIPENQLQAMPEAYAGLMQELQAYGPKFVQAINEAIGTRSISGTLRFMNSPEMIGANHRFYTQFSMMMGNEDSSPGPKMVANWYERNLMITHNILRLYEGPETRVAIIFGQGHSYLLEQFMRESPYFEVVDVLDYIPEE